MHQDFFNLQYYLNFKLAECYIHLSFKSLDKIESQDGYHIEKDL